MIVGFTGTQKNITAQQFDQLVFLLENVEIEEVHHGDCIGADATFHNTASALRIPIIIHPPIDESRRAFCLGAIDVLPPEYYLVRNHAIVNASNMLIACPHEATEQRRSGTWATYRYAKKRGKKVYLILPNGEIL